MIEWLEAKGSTIDRRGCFSTIAIKRDAYIADYEGELISSDEAVRRESDHTREGVYTFWLDDDNVIDGYEHGNVLKYLNHSCTPNCTYEISDGRIKIFALREIEPGEELTIDYDYDPDTELEKCLCGAEYCRGFINNLERA
ncbi:MAG TPA: SET domain-containing protein-lysine N-methyltransferase [Bacteroidota bacterium]|nr:SET domain-containing protein-lysine N-methyltransferase [Bacteroidota bacterium]